MYLHRRSLREHTFWAGLMLLLLSGCDLDQNFIFFPTRELVTTPRSAGLAYEDVYFSGTDGTELHGWLLPGKPQAPMILFFHGNAGNISHRIYNLHLFHERLGVSVFIIDYRGYGNSAGRPDETGTYADARGALAWLHSHGWDNRRIIYFGRSLGAAVATQLALEQPPAGLVLESPFTSVAQMGRRHNPILYGLFGWMLRSRYDNLEKIGQIRAPLLIFHGSHDTVVPLSMAEELFARAGHPKTFHLIPGADHNDTLAHGIEEYWQGWRNFIDSLPAPTPQAPPSRSSR